MGKYVTDYTLYRWRYIIGYSLIGIIIVGLLIVAGLFVPGGLSQAEMQSVVASHSIAFSLDSFDPQAIVNLPYHLLQRGSIELFGLSDLSIKLPSLLLGLVSAFGMLLLLRMWFRRNVSVLTAIIVITTGQFLFIAQSGTPSIMYVFFSIWLLVAAMMISRREKWVGAWKMVLFGIVALSLYTPLSLYILIALASAIVLHPHLRYLVRQLSKVKLLLAGLGSLILLIPIGYGLWRDPSIGLTLLGIPSAWPDLWANILQLGRQYLDFITPTSGAIMTPLYGLGSMILIALGILHLATTKYTARSYIITAWIILLLPVLLINPEIIGVTFLPIVLLIAMGVSTLLGNWYQLFPRNPYARLAGLLPLTVLIGGMVFSGIDRYMYGYTYDPLTANHFSSDLRLLNNQLSQQKDATTLIVSQDERAFYEVAAKNYDNITVSTQLPKKYNTAIISRAAYQPNKNISPALIVADSTANDADRFYIYKSSQK
jgi:hypothetical protein